MAFFAQPNFDVLKPLPRGLQVLKKCLLSENGQEWGTFDPFRWWMSELMSELELDGATPRVPGEPGEFTLLSPMEPGRRPPLAASLK